MSEPRYDTNLTKQRFKRLRDYCEKEAHIAPCHFDCSKVDCCQQKVNSRGLDLVSGGLAHVGEKYDICFDDKSLRILFVGYDYGNCCATLEQRRRSIQCLSGPDLNKSPHYKGIVKVMMEIFQCKCGSEADTGSWRPLLKRMSQTNATRCCAPKEGRMGCNTTEGMRTNCWPHFKKEIELLQPTIIVFHGAALKDSFLHNLDSAERRTLCSSELSEHCQHVTWESFPAPFKSFLLFFNHPGHGQFGRQWDTKVLPVLKGLRDDGRLPSPNTDWKPRKRKEWPRI
jgi:hypothetical protein